MYLCVYRHPRMCRLDQGHVLRILDSKATEDQLVLLNAPLLLDNASDATKDRFARVLEGLEALSVPYQVDARLVRGLVCCRAAPSSPSFLMIHFCFLCQRF